MSAETIVNIITITSAIILVFLGRCIFKPNTQDSYEQVDHCEDDSTQENVKEEKPDISEPVISFVKTFKENPKRFTYVKENDREGLSKKLVTLSTCKVLTDTFTGEVFKIEEVGLFTWWLDHPNIVLTKDEIDYINKEIVTPYKERKARYIETKLNRECVQEKRKELQERRRLTKIYQ